jgi:NADPH:quinone reductase-like Zn-dependent oxidoreductase
MTKAVLLDELGGPEVLEVREVELAEPGPGEVRIRVDAIGLNRADGMFRSGIYYIQPPIPAARIGYEASGEVEAVGEGVTGFTVGDAVSTVPSFHMTDYGVYGDAAIVPASALVRRPDDVDAVTGAAVWMAYLTAYGALVDFGKVRPGDVVLVTAAASSVGLAAIQIANHLGAIPIATTRSADKVQRLLDLGAAHAIDVEQTDLLEEFARIGGNGGRIVDLAFDAVNGPMLSTIAQAVVPDGTLICFGFLGGGLGPLPMGATYPFSLNIRIYEVFHLTTDPERLARAERFIKGGLRSGAFTPLIDRTFPLDEIVEAHRYMEAGAQVGKIVVEIEH